MKSDSRPVRSQRGEGSVVEQLGRSLSQEIIEGILLPGMRLEEATLATRFGVSRTPVREALRHLEATGLVEKRPNRGVVVTTIGRERLAEMFEAMAELEATTARLAALRMTAREAEALRTMHECSRALVAGDDRPGYERFNVAFHEAIYAGAHNGEIASLARAMRRRVAPFRRAQFLVPERPALSFSEHSRVVECILDHRADEAAAEMRAHLLMVSSASARIVPQTNPVD